MNNEQWTMDSGGAVMTVGQDGGSVEMVMEMELTIEI